MNQDLTRLRRSGPFILGMTLFVSSLAFGDEGMWLPDHPPLKLLKQKYGFQPPDGWMENQQKSAVHFGGASGSIVSPDGLVLTNHHVGSHALSKLSTPEHNLLQDGFYAADRSAELKCPGMEVTVLQSTEDITARINAVTLPSMTPAAADAARRKAILSIEKETKDRSGLESHVVTLYNGAQFHLYQSKRYADVRLVFAPEGQIAFFGGDVDNFEYPRFDLDICLFRLYENDKPVHVDHYLHPGNGYSDGDLAMVFGHPGRTQRLDTVNHLRFIRDIALPTRLASVWRRQAELEAFAGRGEENARISANELFGVANGRKASEGRLAALQSPAFIAHKAAAEQKLRAFVDADPRRKAEWGGAWDRLSRALDAERGNYARGDAISHLLSHSELVSHAVDLVRLAAEKPKPNAERLPGYGDASLDRLFHGLYSTAPIYEALEINRLSSDLSRAAAILGGDDPLVLLALDGKSPNERAGELIRGTQLKDVAERKRLAEGGRTAIDASTDPLIRFAVAIDPAARAERRRQEDGIDAAEHEAYEKIAAAAFAAGGDDLYPDATGTLRMSFGRVDGYRSQGEDVPAWTTFFGLYERFHARQGRPPFDLPRRWIDAEKRVGGRRPLNFVLTADIIGGNSGSPVVNESGELIGVIFDGNLQGLGAEFQYDEREGRAIAVDIRGVFEALKQVYGAEALIEEMGGKVTPTPQ